MEAERLSVQECADCSPFLEDVHAGVAIWSALEARA